MNNTALAHALERFTAPPKRQHLHIVPRVKPRPLTLELAVEVSGEFPDIYALSRFLVRRNPAGVVFKPMLGPRHAHDGWDLIGYDQDAGREFLLYERETGRETFTTVLIVRGLGLVEQPLSLREFAEVVN